MLFFFRVSLVQRNRLCCIVFLAQVDTKLTKKLILLLFWNHLDVDDILVAFLDDLHVCRSIDQVVLVE